jgi:DNA-binding NarL/FixJ family response regulator
VIHVVVADDHAVVRTGVRAVLGSEPDLSVVAEAADADGAVTAVLTHHPQVLLLDWTLPGEGRSVIERLRTEAPATRVCVLSMHQDGATVREALGVGALGYVVKGAGIEDLVVALRAVAAGRRFLDPAAETGAASGPEPVDDDEWERLTPRERIVLRRVAEGRTNREIATELSLSPKTVDTHRTNLMRKLGVHDAQALARFAVRRGLL